MNWLTSLPMGTLVVGWLALALLVAALARLAIRALVPAAEHDDVQRIASPLMPALGAAFAIFTGSPCPARPPTSVRPRAS